MPQHPAFAEGRTAVITGGASGIGLAAARRFAELGMKICLADLSVGSAKTARRGLGRTLSVRSENPARRLYERLGFRDFPGSAATNRAGGMSIGMALRR